MNNPGVYTLAAKAITTALPAEAQTAISDLDGMSAVTLVAEMLGGAGGTSIDLLVQTTLDGGTTYLDIARFTFSNTADKRYAVLQGLAAKVVTAYAALAAEGVNDGLLGDTMRCVITSVGAYTDTTISLRASVR